MSWEKCAGGGWVHGRGLGGDPQTRWVAPPQLYPGDTHEALPNLTLKKLTPFLNGLKNVFFQ